MDYKEIEKSIIKKYRKEIWCKFRKAVSDYKLINESDRVMVCISGGKDSTLLAKNIQELQKHGNVPFEAKYVVMDPGYTKETIHKIKKMCKDLNIPITIFKTDIFKIVKHLDTKSPCYMCARMRRGYLYDQAQKLGCNKIALGHHFDDVIETILLSMFYNGEIKTMLPILKSDNFEGLELIRPLYYIREKDIIKWQKGNNLTFINCACNIDIKKSSREEIKKIIKRLEEKNKDFPLNIFKSVNNINLNCILGYKKNGKYYSYQNKHDIT